MNLIDNGIKEVLDVRKVIKDKEMYFEVDLIDWYNGKKTKRFNNIENLEKKTWQE